MKGYMYILRCCNGAYYTGSTNDLDFRLQQHQNGEGANFTRKHLPVELIYYEEFDRIDDAFYREKQIQGWRRAKKEALINGQYNKLRELSKSYASAGSASGTPPGEPVEPGTSDASMNSASDIPVGEPVEPTEPEPRQAQLPVPNLSIPECDGE